MCLLLEDLGNIGGTWVSRTCAHVAVSVTLSSSNHTLQINISVGPDASGCSGACRVLVHRMNVYNSVLTFWTDSSVRFVLHLKSVSKNRRQKTGYTYQIWVPMACPRLSLLHLFILEPIGDTCSGKWKLKRAFWYCGSELSSVTHLGGILTFHTVRRAFGPTKLMKG